MFNINRLTDLQEHNKTSESLSLLSPPSTLKRYISTDQHIQHDMKMTLRTSFIFMQGGAFAFRFALSVFTSVRYNFSA